MALNGDTWPIPLRFARIQMTLSADAKNATNGTLSGIVPTAELPDAIPGTTRRPAIFGLPRGAGSIPRRRPIPARRDHRFGGGNFDPLMAGFSHPS